MFDKDIKELKVREKQALSTPAEQTRPGRVFRPAVDIMENDKEIVLLADMPGVTPEAFRIDLRDNTLTLEGAVKPADKSAEENVLMEYETGTYYRQFSLSEVINQDKIDARVKDGVLCLTLPKVEKAAPRKITVTAA